MSFEGDFAMADEDFLAETARKADAADAVRISGRPVAAGVGAVEADVQLGDGGALHGATRRVTISADDFAHFAVRVGMRVTVPGDLEPELKVMAIRGVGRLRVLYCGAGAAGRTSQF